MKVSCDNCKKCGENTCGNDTENLRCFETRKDIKNKETIKTIKRHLKGIEKAIEKLEKER
jgi:hypothetical protein